MTQIRRREALKLVGGAAIGLAAIEAVTGQNDGPSVEAPDRDPPRDYEDYSTHNVPGDYETIQDAVNAAEPRDLVMVEPGVYHESVEITTPRVTLRGRNRNTVILDGEFERSNATIGHAAHVVVENMTARHYTANGFYWDGVRGYRGSYLTTYNNGAYGIYAFDSVGGRFDNSYASGHPDSGFYIGQCSPCKAIIENIVAEGNALGYSGTNAGGELVLRDSVWRNNMAGIVPNTLDVEYLAPQRGARIENNRVVGNNNDEAPAKAIGFPAFGTGISIAGGMDNLVVGNDVHDHVNFGIAVFPMYDQNFYQPAGNAVRGNSVEGSGRADLALGAPAGSDNVFTDNEAATTRPAGLQKSGFISAPNRSVGDPWVTMLVGKGFLQTEVGTYPQGDWKTAPEPPEQPVMPDPERAPREAIGPEAGQ